MNILIPDSWLREYLKTDATPKEIKEYVSLCGPSVERMNTIGRETVYDIEVTTNRVDSYSVYGIAREAATILPRFGKKAELLPLVHKTGVRFGAKPLGISIQDEGGFCRRILAVKLSGITLAPSPAWLVKKLELVGQRPLNNIVDITNYVMWETGHPMHAFDYDRLKEKKIIVREARKGETVITLDEKTHIMVGGELVFDDGTGTIIDVPGVMGTANTVVTAKTKNVLLFIENSDPSKIRFTSMTHAIRTQAAVINEKDPDPELAAVAMTRAIDLALDLTHGSVDSKLFDVYPKKYKPYSVRVDRTKIDSYIGARLKDAELISILKTLGFVPSVTRGSVTVQVPSFRRDVTIDVDIIEEVARIWGYHTIETHLPASEPPVVMPDKALVWEEDMKTRLRDWGYTEIYSYSMVSEELMDIFGRNTQEAYRISNPLSSDWVYMRPEVSMSLLPALRDNIKAQNALRVFELSMGYRYQAGQLPAETPTLVVIWSGDAFLEAKGIAASLFGLFGISPTERNVRTEKDHLRWYTEKALSFGPYGSLGVMNPTLLSKLDIQKPLTRLELQVGALIENGTPQSAYQPIPKYPPAVEDIAFVVPANFHVGPFMASLKALHPLVHRVSLLDTHENTRTIHVEYLDVRKNLTAEDIRPVREAQLAHALTEFSAKLKQI